MHSKEEIVNFLIFPAICAGRCLFGMFYLLTYDLPCCVCPLCDPLSP